MGADNCGLQRTVASCGVCKTTESCNTGSCSTLPCVPKTDLDLCAAANKNCGIINAVDNCGTFRSPTCGTCPISNVCFTNTCCVPETDAEFCSNNKKNCGSTVLVDNCGTWRYVASCGTCSDPSQTCGGKNGKTNSNVCTVCQPDTCLSLGYECGSYSDGCEKSGNCGECPITGQGLLCSTGKCETYQQLCGSNPKNLFIGSCLQRGGSIDLVGCKVNWDGSQTITDYWDSGIVPGTNMSCSGESSYTCNSGVILKVNPYTWSAVKMDHSTSVGGIALDIVIVPSCSEKITWYYAPNTTQQVQVDANTSENAYQSLGYISVHFVSAL